MPSHQDRIHAKNPEMNCKHLFIYKGDSNIAPFIESNGDRTTISTCINCGLEERYRRSQKTFIMEINNELPS